jgi:hypothetical protein
MTVAVVGADRDESEARVEAVVQGGALIGGAVVRDFDDVHGRDGAGRQQSLLAALVEVPEEQRTEPVSLRLDHDAPLVAGGSVGRGHPGAARRGGRPQEPPRGLSERAGHPLRPRVDRHARGTQPCQDRVVGLADGGAHEDMLRPVDHSGEAADMIGVVVGEHEQCQPGDAETVEAGGGGLRLAADVDHRHLAAVPQEQRVALADVAGGDGPVGRHRDGPSDGPTAQRARVTDTGAGQHGGGGETDHAR